jgi:hypothetical protein
MSGRLQAGNFDVLVDLDAATLEAGNFDVLAAYDAATLEAGLIMVLVSDVGTPLGSGLLQGDFMVTSGLQGNATMAYQGCSGRLQGGLMPGGPQG